MKYEYLEHTADMKFRAYGKSLEEAFENSALAISNFLSRETEVNPKKIEKVFLKAEDKESLLYEFLEHLIFLLDSKSFLISNAKVKISKIEEGFSINAELDGDEAGNYDVCQIKAMTYSEMHIKKKNESYEIQVVMDV